MKQILNQVDNYSDIKPLLYLSKILELAPYTYTKSKLEYRIRISTAHTVHSLVIKHCIIQLMHSIKGVTGGTDQTSGGCSLC